MLTIIAGDHYSHVNPSNAETIFDQDKGAKIFINHLNPAMLIFIGKLCPSALR